MPHSLFARPARQLTVLYDGDCGFCTWTVHQLTSLDRHRRLEFVPLQHAADHPDRPEIAELARRRDLARSLHVVRADGLVDDGGGAMLEILDVLPGGWLLRPWRVLPGVRPTVDAAYRLVADRRALASRLLRRATDGQRSKLHSVSEGDGVNSNA
ncbi:hypothetical protein BH23CHL6_BH23CHL6_11380 [soil metagenome]